MKLTKKHIGQLFDVEGSDGSWYYQLIDVKKDELLFYSLDHRHPYEIESRSHTDWRVFGSAQAFNKRQIKLGWAIGRRV